MWEKLLNQKGKNVKNKWINTNNNNNNDNDDNNNDNEIKRNDKRKRD